MPPIYAAAPLWQPKRSRFIVLYHGCTEIDAKSILANGIDVTRCRLDTDFGRGFYTTTVRYQARQWAWTRYYDSPKPWPGPNRPVVLKFVVDRYRLATLHSLSFVLGGHQRHNYWSLVQHCRRSTPGAISDHKGPVTLPDGSKWYDVVSGPVAAMWRQRYAMHDADQFSFHTLRAVRALQTLIDSADKKRFRLLPVK